MGKMENVENKSVDKEPSINDTERKCIKIPVAKFFYKKADLISLDNELLMRARREFPTLEFSQKLLETEENGDNIDFLFHYK